MKVLTMRQLAPMNIHFVQYPLEYFLDSVQSNGLDRIELWGGGPCVCIDTISFFEIQKISRLVESRGLHIACFTPETCFYPINLASTDPETRRRSLRYCLRGLEIACDLGTPLMQVVSGKGFFDLPLDDSWKYAKENLSILAQRAEEYGMQLTLEPLSPYESNLVNSLEATQQMLSEINSQSIGVNVDTVPLSLTRIPLQAYFNELKPIMNHLHFCDRTPQAGWVPCGDGIMPLQELLQTLDDNEYTASLGLEICGTAYYTDPAGALTRAVNHLRTYIEA